MTREIDDGIHWIEELGPDRSGMVIGDDATAPDWYDPSEAVYIPQCAYLLVGDDETLLFDTLSPASTETILEETRSILDGRSLDYLVVSHPDVPHAGNATAILEAFEDVELVAPGYGNDHELYRLEEARHVMEGDTIDLGGLEVAFHEATFLDAPVSVWMTERTTGTLFPVDWLGFPHLASETYRFVDEIESGLDASRLVQFHGRVLFWYQYVDVEKVGREIDRLIETFDPEMIAPAHGLVIREEPVAVMERMKEVVATVDAQGRVGTLG